MITQISVALFQNAELNRKLSESSGKLRSMQASLKRSQEFSEESEKKDRVRREAGDSGRGRKPDGTIVHFLAKTGSLFAFTKKEQMLILKGLQFLRNLLLGTSKTRFNDKKHIIRTQPPSVWYNFGSVQESFRNSEIST